MCSYITREGRLSRKKLVYFIARFTTHQKDFLNIKSHRKLQIRSPKIANAKTYTYPRIQQLPYVIRICILHISLRVYSLDSGADNSNYHLDKIVSNLQVLVIKTGKFTKTMSIGLLQMLFGYSFVSSTYLFYPSDRYLQLSVTLYNGYANFRAY